MFYTQKGSKIELQFHTVQINTHVKQLLTTGHLLTTEVEVNYIFHFIILITK